LSSGAAIGAGDIEVVARKDDSFSASKAGGSLSMATNAKVVGGGVDILEVDPSGFKICF